MTDPMALKERTLRQLLEIRETLLSVDCQEMIDQKPQEMQREYCQIISQAQINYLKLQRASLEELSKEMLTVENELLESMKSMQESIDDLSRLEKFMTDATGFIRLVQRIVSILPLTI